MLQESKKQAQQHINYINTHNTLIINIIIALISKKIEISQTSLFLLKYFGFAGFVHENRIYLHTKSNYAQYIISRYPYFF